MQMALVICYLPFGIATMVVDLNETYTQALEQSFRNSYLLS